MNKKTYYGFVETDGGMKYRTQDEPSLDEMQKWVGGLIEYAPVRPGAKFQYHVDRENMVWGTVLGAQKILSKHDLLEKDFCLFVNISSQKMPARVEVPVPEAPRFPQR